MAYYIDFCKNCLGDIQLEQGEIDIPLLPWQLKFCSKSCSQCYQRTKRRVGYAFKVKKKRKEFGPRGFIEERRINVGTGISKSE